mmetsp:Transcript_8656/g.14052  ORF Transcript_8656/g.14052 Transcript_8656/m.14052 type:complete len:537 (-) Transcript_8656:133-1743(-)
MEDNTPPPGMDEDSLCSMKQSALQRWAFEIGASEDEIDEAVDSADAKSALVSLILGRARQGGLSAVRPAPILTSTNSMDPVRLAVNQPFLQMESVPLGQFARRNSDAESVTVGGYQSNYVDDDEDEYTVGPDSPMTIGRTNSIRSHREEIEPDAPLRTGTPKTPVVRLAQSEPAKPPRQTPKDQRQSAKSQLAQSNSERRESDDKGRRRTARRGSDDAQSRRSSADPYGYGSRRASYASTAYDEDESGFPQPPMGLPPYGGVMPPPMGMMPPMAPPGFHGTNPWLAAAAAMGQMTGMPMMSPPGYPNPLMPPPFSPELGYPPGVYPPYPMQPSVPTERRGSTDRRNSTGDRSHRKGSTGQAMTSQKSDPAEKKAAKIEEQTTLLLRNLPEAFTRTTLQNLLNTKTFQGRYDFIYMPMNFRTKASFGYAFVNFVGHKDAQECYDLFHGYTSWEMPSSKVCDVSWSSMHQGLPAHIDRYRNSPVMHESVEDEYKPAVFSLGSGDRAVFPPPTKKLRVPRIRRPGADGEGDDDDGANDM